MTNLDGPTTVKDTFSGPIGKAAKQADSLQAKVFEAIPVERAIRNLPAAVVNDLLSDQKYLYQITSVRSGSTSASLYTTKLGRIDH